MEKTIREVDLNLRHYIGDRSDVLKEIQINTQFLKNNPIDGLPVTKIKIEGMCGTYCNYFVEDIGGLMNIFGLGEISRFDHHLHEKTKRNIKEMMIGYGISAIGNNLFQRFTSLKKITIASTV